MQVEILVEFKHGRDVYHPDEVVISNEGTDITESVLKFWCDAGWARDVAGLHPTGAPGAKDVVLLVDNVDQTTTQEALNG